MDNIGTHTSVTVFREWPDRRKKARTEVMEHVLKDKEEGELGEHGLPRWEGHLPSAHSTILGDGVKEEYL